MLDMNNLPNPMDAPLQVHHPEDGHCGKPLTPLGDGERLWFSCVLPLGHSGECRRGGKCLEHGPYIGIQCPKCPLRAWRDRNGKPIY